MEKTDTKAKLVLALFLMALLLSGAQGGRYVPENQSMVIATNANNQQLFWFGSPLHIWIKKWFFDKWFGPYPLKADLNKQNVVPRSKTTGGDASVAASTVYP